MSVQAITWALAQQVERSGAKFILVCLANYADKDGMCWPGQEKLAHDASMSERQVRRHLEYLEQLKFISREPRYSKLGGRTSDCYQLGYRTPCPVSEGDFEVTGHEGVTGQKGGGYRTNTTGLPDRVSGIYKDEPVREPLEEPSEGKVNADGVDPPDRLPVNQAFEHYNIAAAELGLPVAQKLTAERRRKLRLRLQEHGLDGWDRALCEIERSAFLRGENNRGWRPNLDFMLQASSLNKLIEGGYADHAGEN